MTFATRIAVGLVLAYAAVSATADVAQAKARIYVMRGLLDVSTGLDVLGSKLRRQGHSVVVSGYGAEADLAAAAISNYRSAGCPVVIIGHSLGADAAVNMAGTLKQASVPVALLVAFSPANSGRIPSNVSYAVNYYQSNSVWNFPYVPDTGFKGSLRNVDLARMDSVDHFNIEKLDRLHAATIQKVAGFAGCRR